MNGIRILMGPDIQVTLGNGYHNDCQPVWMGPDFQATLNSTSHRNIQILFPNIEYFQLNNWGTIG